MRSGYLKHLASELWEPPASIYAHGLQPLMLSCRSLMSSGDLQHLASELSEPPASIYAHGLDLGKTTIKVTMRHFPYETF